MTAPEIINKFIKFYEDRGHVRIPNASLVPENDPTTLFTSSGMQPLVPYLLGAAHPQGVRLVNVQNCFRAQDIDEIGDARHTTFFRMLGNWSLGEESGYYKKEQIPWVFEFLTKQLNIDPAKLYVTVFKGYDDIPRDNEAVAIWSSIFESLNLDPEERIFYYGVEKNWWSRSGTPDTMPEGEPGGPDTEIFYDFETPHDASYGPECHLNCDCGRYWEIANSVFMQYKKTESGFEDLPQKNVDFGGGVERLIAVSEGKNDVFEDSLLSPIIKTLENVTGKKYSVSSREMRIICDHLVSAVFIAASGVRPANKDKGYILRRLLRRSFDNFDILEGNDLSAVVSKIVDQYRDTDEYLVEKFESIKNTILEEQESYGRAIFEAKKFINKKYPSASSGQAPSASSGQAPSASSGQAPSASSGQVRTGDELKGETQISAEDAFSLYASHGLSPTQIKSLGFIFDEQEFAEKIKQHQDVSRSGAKQKFAGGLADHAEGTIKGHTATHLLHQALRDVLGDQVHQTGSNITSARVRFDFSYDKKLTPDEIARVEQIVNEKIEENLPVHFEIMPLEKAKKIGAIGLFDEKYEKDVKVYFIGDYSKEFCGGPHVDFTHEVKTFRIIKDESLGQSTKRIYAEVS